MSLAIVRASSARKRQNSGSSVLEGIQLIPIHCAPLRFCLSAYVAEVKDVHREGVELETPDLDTIWQTIATAVRAIQVSFGLSTRVARVARGTRLFAVLVIYRHVAAYSQIARSASKHVPRIHYSLPSSKRHRLMLQSAK